MPQYVVKLEGGGEMRVNASSPEAARSNVSSQGGTPQNVGSTTGGKTNAAATNEYGDQIYQTPNGMRTGTEIMQELKDAGWDGQGDPVQVYNATASGASPTAGTPGGTDDPKAAAAPGNPDKLTNVNAASIAFQNAQQAAYQAYLNARLALDTDDLAFRKATEAFNESIKAAEMTGSFNGQTTMAAQKQYFDQGIETQKFQQGAAQSYLDLLSKLRGPEDYGQYLRTMGSTPQGLQSLVAGAAGQFVPGTGATTGVDPTAVTLPGFINTATGYQPAQTGAPAAGGGTSYEQYMAAARGLPQPNQIAPQAWNAMTDVQKKLMMGMYEQKGWNINDVQQLYQQSLPKFGAPTPQAGQTRLV